MAWGGGGYLQSLTCRGVVTETSLMILVVDATVILRFWCREAYSDITALIAVRSDILTHHL